MTSIDKTDKSRDHGLKRSVRVDFQDNDLKGLINIASNTFIQYKPTVEELKNIIFSSGIKYGLDDNILETIVKRKIEEQWVEVAWGKPAIQGKDGYITYKFKTEEEFKLKEDEHGRVNLKELNKIENVVKDQLLAVHIAPEYGKPGISVKRLTLHPERVQDVKLYSGKNTYLSDDGNELFASCDGMVTIRKNHIDVDPVYVVSGDVGPTTGNIDFVGSVIIKGSVLDGFTVKAAEEIQISGSIGAANIESGKNIKVTGGINGKEKGTIHCETLSIKFINQANVYSKNNIKVNDFIMHSNIYTGGMLMVEEGKGTIMGGHIISTRGIKAKTIGSEATPHTVAECGLPYEIFARFIRLENNFIKFRKVLIESNKNIPVLERLESEGKLDDEKLKLLDNFIVARKKCLKEILSISVETRLLFQESDDAFQSIVSASKVYPNCEFLSPKNIVKIQDIKNNFYIKIENGSFVTQAAL